MTRSERARARKLSRSGKKPVEKPAALNVKPLNRTQSLTIGALCVVAGGDLRCELEAFLSCAKFYHPEWPIYVVTDDRPLTDTEIEFVDEVLHLSREEISQLGNVEAKHHEDRWHRGWIAAKMQGMKLALERWPETGILFCDSDIVFTARLPAMEWNADVVLSEHTGPGREKRQSTGYFGRYNAGLLLTDDLAVIERWEEMYRTGIGNFYEQGCLEQLAEEFVTDHFPSTWNWGMWRWRENLGQSDRPTPPLLHVHTSGPFAERDQRPATVVLRDRARKAIGHVAYCRDLPEKIAFVHFAKAAGSSFIATACPVLKSCNYQVLDSFGLGLARDWLPDELDAIAAGNLWGQVGDRWFVHNHAQNWPEETVRSMAADGWRFVAFYRPVRERLKSFFTWSQKCQASGLPHPMAGPVTECKNLNEHVREMLTNPRYESEWALPDWADLLEWFPASDEGISRAVEFTTGMKCVIKNVNHSAGAPLKFSAEAKRLLDQDPRVAAWEKFEKENHERF